MTISLLFPPKNKRKHNNTNILLVISNGVLDHMGFFCIFLLNNRVLWFPFRGDIVIAKSPFDPNMNICKRVIGLEGDKVCTSSPSDLFKTHTYVSIFSSRSSSLRPHFLKMSCFLAAFLIHIAIT